MPTATPVPTPTPEPTATPTPRPPLNREALLSGEDFQRLSSTHPRLYETVQNQPRLYKGVARDSILIGLHLDQIARESRYLANRISEMPFLETVDPPDAQAMYSLSRLSRRGISHAETVLAHPGLKGGITDESVHLIVPIYNVYGSDPFVAEKLLTPGLATVETRTIYLPLAGEVELAIVRVRAGSERSMDLHEHSVRSAENAMDVPFPSNYAFRLFLDTQTENTPSGVSDGSLVSNPEYDGGRRSNSAGGHMGHETAHYYWTGGLVEQWISEGLSDLMAIISENSRIGAPLVPSGPPCAYYESIDELQRETPGYASLDLFRCYYLLGQRLFLDLRYNLEEEEFRRGLGNLYGMAGDRFTRSNRLRLGVVEVERAFKTDASDEAKEAVDAAINRWYYGTEPQVLFGRHLIRGFVVGPTGKPLEGIGLWFWQGSRDNSGYGKTIEDGSFVVEVPKGNFFVCVYANDGGRLGMYDGEGITSNRDERVNMVVDDKGVDEIIIKLPGEPDTLPRIPRCG